MSLAQQLLASPAFQQIAPLIVVFLVPLLTFVIAARVDASSISHNLAMVLESLGMALPWNWNNSQRQRTVSLVDKKVSKRSRTRSERGHGEKGANRSSSDNTESVEDGYYPGLVNVSGVYCYMNSTIQAMASLCYLRPWLDAILEKAITFDVPTHVVDALQELLNELNTPRRSYTSMRPMRLIQALSNPSPEVKRNNSLMYSRDHQDAQELFQLVSECIKAEAAEVEKESRRDRGLGGLSMEKLAGRDVGKSVFDGLTANRRSCVECGYTEAVMHFPFDNWQLNVPRLASSCKLEDCLQDYTRLELLTDCICRRCSMIATHKRLVQEMEKLNDALKADPNASQSKKKRAKEAKKLEARVKAALDEGRIEDELKDVKMEKVFSKASTKQAMIARPPPVLALHLNRSVHYGSYAAKNTIHVQFQELLDLTPFTTSGKLSTVPSVPISSPAPAQPRSTTPTPSTYSTSRTLYRLSSVVCHYGQHSFGHYICYRRKPHPAPDKQWAPPRLLSDPIVAVQKASGHPTFAYEVGKARADDQVMWDGDEDQLSQRGTGRGWLRISDDSVREVGIETVLAESSAVFMLYYERVLIGHSPYSHAITSGCMEAAIGSDETLKPEVVLHRVTNGHANGSMTSLLSVPDTGIGVGVKGEKNGSRMVGPRVIRNVALRRAKSLEAPQIEREVTSSRDLIKSMVVKKVDIEPSPGNSSPTLNGDATLATSGRTTSPVPTPAPSNPISAAPPPVQHQPKTAPSPHKKAPKKRTSSSSIRSEISNRVEATQSPSTPTPVGVRG